MDGYSRTLSISLCLSLLLFAMSCARVKDFVSENPRTAAGTGVGAAVAGGLLGALAGGAVGNALESKNEDYASTAEDYNFRPGQKPVVRIEDVDADPSRLTSRDTVHLVVRYALLPSDGNEKVKVTERWQITHNGKIVGDPVISMTRTGGTWSSAVPLRLPSNADDGLYRARVEVHAAETVDQGSTTFTLR